MINKHEKRMKKSEKDERGAVVVQFSIDNSGEIGSLRIMIPKNVLINYFLI